MDERIRQAFEKGGPRTVLAQGPMSPYGLLVATEDNVNGRPNGVVGSAPTVNGSETDSVDSSWSGRPNVVHLSGGITVDPHEVVRSALICVAPR